MTGPDSEGLQACDGHVVILPDPTTPSGYPECSTCSDDPDTDPRGRCSALVLAVEAKRPCPDGGRHYEGVCVHYGPGGVDHAFPSSPVVPSVGAVPVEVPAEAVDAVMQELEPALAAVGVTLTPAVFQGRSYVGRKLIQRVAPLIAARARAEAFAERAAIIEVLSEFAPLALPHNDLPTIVRGIALQRDNQHELKDHLAEVARKLTDDSARRFDQEISRSRDVIARMDMGRTGGSAATPAEPVDEVVCPNCEHTIRARMSDQPGPCTSECGKPADQTCLQWACRKAGADLAAPAEQDGQR